MRSLNEMIPAVVRDHGEKRHASPLRSDSRQTVNEGLHFDPNANVATPAVTLGQHPKYNPGKGDFSVEIWARPEIHPNGWNNALAGCGRYIWPGDPNFPGYTNASSGWYLERRTDGKLSFAVYEPRMTGGAVAEVRTQDTVSPYQWHHIVAVRKGNKADSFKLYVDGQWMAKSIAANQLTHGNLDTLQGIGRLTLGDLGVDFPTHNFLKGALKGFRFWKRALSDSEIAASYSAGCGQRLSTDATLVIDMPMWEGKDTTVYDQSPFPVHGKFYVGYGSNKHKWQREIKDTGCWMNGMTNLCEKGGNEQATYAYGFNGMMKEDDWQDDGNTLDFGARMYDPRLGRWLAVDPLQQKYPYLSPLSISKNNPVIYYDPDGKKYVIYYEDEKGNTQQYEYGSKMKMPNSDFVIQSVAALNELSKYCSIEKDFDKMRKSETEFAFVKSDVTEANPQFGTDYKTGGLKVTWVRVQFNSTIALKQKSTGKINAPFVSLWHELGHGLDALNDPEGFTQRSAKENKYPKGSELEKWSDPEEKYNIENNEWRLLADPTFRGGFKREGHKVDGNTDYKQINTKSSTSDEEVSEK